MNLNNPDGILKASKQSCSEETATVSMAIIHHVYLGCDNGVYQKPDAGCQVRILFLEQTMHGVIHNYGGLVGTTKNNMI